MHPRSEVAKIEKENDETLTLHLTNGEVHSGFDVILCAIGRSPLSAQLNLSSVNITTIEKGYIPADEYQNTCTPGIYALGDVCGKVELTPMAIAAARRLADRYDFLFCSLNSLDSSAICQMPRQITQMSQPSCSAIL